MTGRGLERFGRAILRASTFETIVAPAIADLQYESRSGRWASVRAYAGAWRGLAAAVALELGSDCRDTLRHSQLGAAVLPSLLALGLSFAIVSPWGIWLDLGRLRPWHHDVVLLALLIPGVLASTLPLAAMPVARVLAGAGTPGSMRSAVLLAAAVVSTLTIADWLLADRTSDLQRELTTASIMSVRTSEARRPLWELRERFQPRFEHIAGRADDPRWRTARAAAELRRSRIERHTRAALLFTVVAYALLGAAGATRLRHQAGRREPWRSALGAVLIFASFAAMRVVFQRVLYVQTIFGPLVLVWPPAVLLVLVAMLAALRARRVSPKPT